MARTASIISKDDPYLYVRVLLVSWEGADRRLDEELQGLEQTFKDVYEFTTAQYKIQSNNPFGGLTTTLLEFLKHDDPDTLLILYYGGHGYSNSDNQLIWSLYSGGTPCVNWTALQQHVFDKKSDFLILLDCCTAASAVGERQTGNVEVLFSCGIQDKTPISGDYCFTRRLSNMIRQHPDGIEVYELFHRLTQEYNKAGPDRRDKGKEPAYLKPGKDLRRSIQLRRVNSFYSAKSVIALGRRSLRSLRSSRRPAEATRALETVLVLQTSTGNRGDDSSVATRSTMYYSIANGDEAAGPEGADVMEEESTQFSEILSALAEENLRVLNATMDRIETDQDFGDASMEGPETPSFSPPYEPFKIKRLRNEIRMLQEAMANGSATTWFTISPISDTNILEWQATLRGPDGTPYEGGLFHVRLSLTNIDYPFCAPRVWFHTNIYHPNIDKKTGAICADYLEDPPKVVVTFPVEVINLGERRRRDAMGWFAEERRRRDEWFAGEAPQNLSHNQNAISLREPEDATSQSQVGIRAFMPPPIKKREENDDINRYSAASGREALVVGLYVLLNEPNLTDALEPEIARQMIEDPAGYERTAREWTKLYATGAV